MGTYTSSGVLCIYLESDALAASAAPITGNAGAGSNAGTAPSLTCLAQDQGSIAHIDVG